MEIVIAESAGFCFGVRRAVETAYDLVSVEHTDFIYSFGEIIHNNVVLKDLETLGMKIINDADSNKINSSRVIVRAHGIGRDTYNKLKKNNVEIIDMTCPFVKKIHDIVHNYYNNGYTIVIVGDKNHPEVIGINGWCNNSAIILYDDLEKVDLKHIDKVCVVAQTTITRQKWIKVINYLLESVKHLVINDTICNATNKRQNEAYKISKSVDLMLIIGSEISSNTQKLLNISREHCKKSYLIEYKSDLTALFSTDVFNNVNSIGITAGASTPQSTINEIIQSLYSKFDMNNNIGC